jgi:hypothetical protein
MVRVLWALAAILACMAAGVAGALAGMGVALGWPMSPQNFHGTVPYGCLFGGVGAFAVACVVIGWPRTQSCLPVLIWGTVLTFLVSLTAMWWYVVSNLG